MPYTTDILNNSNPESLREYADQIKKFSILTLNSMDDFFDHHLKANRYWQGNQYDQYTEQFRILCKKVEQEIRELMEFRKKILLKADELERKQNINLDIMR